MGAHRVPIVTTVKAIQDAVAIVTALRTMRPEDPSALLAVVDGRTHESMVRALLVLATIVVDEVDEDYVQAMGEAASTHDRHETLAL